MTDRDESQDVREPAEIIPLRRDAAEATSEPDEGIAALARLLDQAFAY